MAVACGWGGVGAEVGEADPLIGGSPVDVRACGGVVVEYFDDVVGLDVTPPPHPG